MKLATVSRLAGKAIGWLALAYLGYWIGLILDRVFVPLAILRLAGAPAQGWSVTPFRIAIQNGDLHASAAMTMFILVLPMLLEIVFLLLLTKAGARLRPAVARIGLHFAAIWVILLLASQVAVFGWLGRGPLARLLAPLAGSPPFSLVRRIACAAAAALLLLAAGRICAGRLIADASGAATPRRNVWVGLLGVILPVLLILCGAFNVLAAIRFLGLRAVFYLFVPAAACLVVALLGLTWKPRHVPGAGLTGQGALAATFVAAALFAGLQQAPRVQPWLSERHLQSISSVHYQVLFDPKAYSAESIRAFASERERILAAQAARLGAPLDAERLRVVLYPSLISLRAATGSERLYSVDGTTIREALGDFIDRVDPAADAAALLNAAWGKPGSARVGEWVARWLAGEWRGRPVEPYAAQIEAEVGHYTLAQLAASSSDGFLSPLVRQPLGAAWIDTQFASSGLAAVRRLYSAKPGEPDLSELAARLGATPAQLEQDWQRWATGRASMQAADPPPVRPADPEFFFRGISFSYEGWGGRGGGYISPEAAAELRRLKGMGANAIAVVPYGFSRGPNEETISYTDTDETDEELTRALHVAHSLGMKVMLKPQLWVVRGEFTGTIRFDDPAARAAWMRNYREFILHYARLAELEQFDLLSIGTEFGGLTAYPDDWRKLIVEVRRVYLGPLTYAANWGPEFESLGFWDALDYLSVNNYYPLASTPSTRVEDLLPGAERLADRLEAVSRKWHKPILFTEVGYPSVRGGSNEPWAEGAGRGISLEEQAAAYEATFRAFSTRPWFRGMFWWKWPSSGRGGGPQDPSFTPLGKPAAEVLRAWFTQMAVRKPPARTP